MNWDQCGPLAEQPVEASEILSHYLFRKELRPDDTVKPEAVIPYPHEALSATRHEELTNEDIWDSGRVIAAMQGRTLMGRADFKPGDMPKGLNAIPDEPPRNHANIIGWPSERSAQMAQALLLAGACVGRRLSA